MNKSAISDYDSYGNDPKRIKYFCAVVFFVMATFFGWCQELQIKELSAPSSKEYSDLHFLKEEIESKKLVLLGEMTHMYGNIFEMKARIVEFLHKEMGFNTIAMESSMYDLWLMNKSGKFVSEDFNRIVFDVWSNTEEFQRLVRYIEQNHIKVVGIDSQVENVQQFIEDFFNYCKQQHIQISLREDDMGIVMESVLESLSYENYDIGFSDFEKQLNNIIDAIKKLETTETNTYWLQFTRNILACTHDAYYNKEPILSSDYADKEDNFRDAQMADNLWSYIDRNKNDKIIVWTDNIHGIRDMSSIKKNIVKEFVPMGMHISKTLGSKMYSLAVVHANDSLLEKQTWHATPILENSFESKLKRTGYPYLFVTSDQKEMKKIQQHRLLNYIDFTEGRLDQLFDGYVFLNAATPPKKEKVVNSKKHNSTDGITDNKTMVHKEANMLKAQVLDEETNMPIPYASIVLKELEIYRISDENGKFELPLSLKFPPGASMNISSMGYASKNIPLQAIGDTVEIRLNPNLILLDEVEIVGYRSPVSVVKQAIKNIKLNHPTSPFTYYNYLHTLENKNDGNIVDVEVVAKEYELGYRQPYNVTRRVEQIQWHKNQVGNSIKSTGHLRGFDANAFRFCGITHKRRYQKYDMEFLKSKNIEDEGRYIIGFRADRNKWNYTRRSYPTSYYGKIYIDKEDFAVVKIVQNWETTLMEDEIEKYKAWLGGETVEGAKEIRIREERVHNYGKMEDSKYYAINYNGRKHIELTAFDYEKTNYSYEYDSKFFNIETDEVEEIEYKFFLKDGHRLNRVDVNEDFWSTFNKRDPGK